MTEVPVRATWRRALLGHAALAGIAAVVVTVAATAGAWRTGRQQTGRDATQVSKTVAAAVIAGLAEYDFAEPAGYNRAAVLDRLEPFLRSGTLHRVKLWIVCGDKARIVVSDVPGLEGTTRTRDAEPLRSIGSGGLRSRDVPDDGEHRYESDYRRGLREAFVDFRDAAGHTMSLEAYVPVNAGTLTAQAVATQLPPLLAGVFGLALATVPLSLAAARRARRRAAHDAALATLAMTAAERERRELAQRLHDGPIQQLAAANVVLSVDPATPLARTIVRDSIRELRTLTDDVLPPDLTAAELASRLPVLLRAAVPEPIALDVRVAGDEHPLGLTDAHALLIARSARELVRNAVRHGGPATITVTLTVTDRVRLTVADDGVGFDPRQPPGPGHFGLALTAQAIADAGGTLDIRSRPDAGCTASVHLPFTA
ncbi:sensor histidine kinase [Dactylosporangium sp. CA-233914]|uniref:sensor histidine kinase n=1 Tax=Dactylosporangium sp. CA-233914 TaxID=3239934 RepID=UPI003D8D37B8